MTERTVLSVTTFNCWGHYYWPARRRALVDVIERAGSSWDVLFLQECDDNIVAAVDEGSHGRLSCVGGGGSLMDCVDRFDGNCGRDGCRHCHGVAAKTDDESSTVPELGVAVSEKEIYDPATPFTVMDDAIAINNNVVELECRGTVPLQPSMNAHRRLHWAVVRLRESNTTVRLLVATAHFTYTQHPRELETGINPRIEQSRAACAFLKAKAEEAGVAAVIFGGDLNDGVHPALAFKACGFEDPHATLHVRHGLTWPWSFPLEDEPPQVLDFLFYLNVPDNAQRVELQPLCVSTVDAVYKFDPLQPPNTEFPVPSDHKPVHCMFEVRGKKQTPASA